MRGALLLSLAGLSLALPTTIPGKNSVPGHPLHNANRLAVPKTGSATDKAATDAGRARRDLADDIKPLIKLPEPVFDGPTNPVKVPGAVGNTVNDAASEAGLAGRGLNIPNAANIVNNAANQVGGGPRRGGQDGGVVAANVAGVKRGDIAHGAAAGVAAGKAKGAVNNVFGTSNPLAKPVVPGTRAVNAADLNDPTNPFSNTPNAGSTVDKAATDAGLARRTSRTATDPAVELAEDVLKQTPGLDGASGTVNNAGPGAGLVQDVEETVVGERGVDTAHGNAAGTAEGDAQGAAGDAGATGGAAGAAAGNAQGAVGNVAGDVVHKRGDIAYGSAAGSAAGQAAGAVGNVLNEAAKRGEDPLAWGSAGGSAAGTASGAIGNIGKEVGRD
ncbi:hypothetical protein B0J18DRAFT_413980 [Chaetomium sp. MPI-SDFR-AT-0129]|nr:hypothetical protein B0J18DRAFT_413980 [Chaetomium sp. MPI-SDFR-AT-0129]